MAVQNIKKRQYEEKYVGATAPMMLLSAVAVFGVALLLMYIAVAEPQPGTAMGAIRSVMRGLGGSLAPALPLVVAWGGVLCVLAGRGKRISAFKAVCDIAMLLALFAAVHMFFVERIRLERMTIMGFANFVSKSYGYGAGGGAVGALLAWPLYRNFGVAGGFIGALLIALLCLTATGRVTRLARWLSDRMEMTRQKQESRAAAREKDELVFDEHFEQPRRRARRGVPQDPMSEGILGMDHSQSVSNAQRRQRPRRARTEGQAGREATVGGPRRRTADGDMSRVAAPQGAEGQNRRSRRRDKANPESTDRRVAEAIAEMEAAARAQAARPEGASPAQPAARPRKRKRLYVENVAAEAPKPGPEALKNPDIDDFDLPNAESILKDQAEADAKRAFRPDRPSAQRQEGPIDLPEEELSAPKPASEPDPALSMEDLKIEPEAYETPDDDTPFDIPSRRPKGKSEPLPKIRREEMKVTVDEDAPEYNYPPIDLLASGESEDVSRHARKDMEKAQLLTETLESFGISARLTGIAHGPAVTRFELQPAPGIKVSRITSLSDDIALNLAAMSVRIEAPIPGKAAVGVEIPNDKVEMVRLRDVLESQEARKHPSRIAVGLGKDNSGRYIVADIAKMPHVLIAGQTGSGKSVCINAIIASILFRASPEEVRLILIDPKVVELSIYNDIPHLVCPVVTDPKKAASALDWAVAEMTKRYKMFAEKGVRDIKGYNKSLSEGEKAMPQMVIIIDELADLMMVSPGEVEDSICRIAQLARACGMHLVIATQRPSVNVITGIIKANIPTRIAFSVASQVDSRTMIDHGGAEKLLGNGDMLFVPNGGKSMRVQGAWVSDDEVHAIVSYIKQSGEAVYDPDMLEHLENATRSDAEKEDFASEYDPKLPEAVDIVLELGQASISMLQRRMRIGYARAGRIIDEMAQRGIVSEADGAKPREVLVTREQAQLMFEDEGA